MRTLILSLVLLVSLPLFADDGSRRIERDVVVNAPRADVSKALTTAAGWRDFFPGVDAKIDLSPGGAYEIYFAPAQPAGLRGGETNRVIALDPERWILFSWNAPPKFGPLRQEHTYVLVRFDDAGPNTRLRLTHFGWRSGTDWDAVYAYFDHAWDLVLGKLQARFEQKRASLSARP